MNRKAKFYKDLWEQAEAARKASDEDVRALALSLYETVAAMGNLARLLEDDPNPLVRGEARKLLAGMRARS